MHGCQGLRDSRVVAVLDPVFGREADGAGVNGASVNGSPSTKCPWERSDGHEEVSRLDRAVERAVNLDL